MTTRQEIAEALDTAVEQDQPIRFNAEATRVLHAMLLDAHPDEHTHAWQPLGYDRASADTAARVVSACSCGEAREVTP